MNEIAEMVSTRALPEVVRAIQRGIIDHICSAAQCVASVQGAVMHRQPQGTVTFEPPKLAVDNATLFDLGDLSMPLGAGLATLQLVAQHRLDITVPVARVLPEFGSGPHAQITIDMLLDHTSGLPADAPVVEALRKTDRLLHPDQQVLGRRTSAAQLRQLVAQTPLLAPPGTQTLVSRVGFMVLGWVLEGVTGKPLDVWLNQEIYQPLTLDDELLFLPPDAKRRLGKPPVCAANGTCPFRDRRLRGEVHDPMAWALGGVAGHAGLFGTASGVWRLAQRLLECSHAAHGFFHTGTLNRFWTKSRRMQTTRTLVWDTPTMLQSSAGKRLSRTSVSATPRPRGPRYG